MEQQDRIETKLDAVIGVLKIALVGGFTPLSMQALAELETKIKETEE